MEKKCIYLYAPSASEPHGHSLYVQNLVKHMSPSVNIFLYTMKDDYLNEILVQNGANLITNEKFITGRLTKDAFRKFGIFSTVIYGFKRIGFSYSMLHDYYKKMPSDIAIFHLLEFEYFAAWVYFILHPKYLKRSILGFHAADFHWIKGRGFQINAYKTVLSFFLPRLIKKSLLVTSMGVTLKKQFAKSLGVEKYLDKIIITGYGNDTQFNNIDKSYARAFLGLPEVSVLGLFFGAVRKNKGILDLLSHLKYIDKSITLVIAGSLWDISENSLDEIIKENKIEDRIIKRLGYMSENDIKFYFSASDFVFLTHKNSFYSFSGPLSLSVEHQRPVIASDVAEIGYFVRRFNLGSLINPQQWNDSIPIINEFIAGLNSGKSNFHFDEALEYNSWKSVADRNIDMYIKAGTLCYCDTK